MGEVPIVICIIQEIWMDKKHMTLGHSATAGVSNNWTSWILWHCEVHVWTSLYLQNDPLHYPQIVKDGHHAAEEHNNRQSLREKTQPVKLFYSFKILVSINKFKKAKSSIYLKGKNVCNQIPKNKWWPFFGVVKEYLQMEEKWETWVMFFVYFLIHCWHLWCNRLFRFYN